MHDEVRGSAHTGAVLDIGKSEVVVGDARTLGEPRRAYHPGVSAFPVTRMRRFRRTASLRGLVRETNLQLDQFVMPLFVAPEPLANDALPGMARHDLGGLLREVDGLASSGVRALMLFGVPAEKDEEATGAWE